MSFFQPFFLPPPGPIAPSRVPQFDASKDSVDSEDDATECGDVGPTSKATRIYEDAQGSDHDMLHHIEIANKLARPYEQELEW